MFKKICDKVKYFISKKEVVLQIVLIKILERSEWIDIIFYLLKKLTFHNFIILIKSVVDKNENKYYYNLLFRKRFA